METGEQKKLREMLVLVRKMALHGIGKGSSSEVESAELLRDLENNSVQNGENN
jgi:hypothetical protein